MCIVIGDSKVFSTLVYQCTRLGEIVPYTGLEWLV